MFVNKIEDKCDYAVDGHDILIQYKCKTAYTVEVEFLEKASRFRNALNTLPV